MITTPILAIPDPECKLQVEVNISGHAIGGVLSQLQPDKSWRPISYISQSLNETKQNYEIYDRELLAIMIGLKQWRQYLIGSNKFEVWTDHKNLEHFRKPQKLNCHQARWLSELQDYNFKIIHKSGNLMKKADTLSRQPDHDLGKEDSEERTVLKGEWFREMKPEGGKFWKEIEEADEAIEEEVREAVEEGREGWTKKGRVLIWKKQLYVPDSSTLREEIISHHHKLKLAGHLGYTKTHELVTRNPWWPRMMSNIKRFIAGCEKCQATKPDRQQKQVQLYPNKVPSHPWETVSVDLVGLLPSSTGSNRVITNGHLLICD